MKIMGEYLFPLKKITNKDELLWFKKIKRDKKYSISTKDKILLESLKSDGFEILSKLSGLILGSLKNNMQSYASKLSKSNLSSVSEIVLCDVIRT